MLAPHRGEKRLHGQHAAPYDGSGLHTPWPAAREHCPGMHAFPEEPATRAGSKVFLLQGCGGFIQQHVEKNRNIFLSLAEHGT